MKSLLLAVVGMFLIPAARPALAQDPFPNTVTIPQTQSPDPFPNTVTLPSNPTTPPAANPFHSTLMPLNPPAVNPYLPQCTITAGLPSNDPGVDFPMGKQYTLTVTKLIPPKPQVKFYGQDFPAKIDGKDSATSTAQIPGPKAKLYRLWEKTGCQGQPHVTEIIDQQQSTAGSEEEIPAAIN